MSKKRNCIDNYLDSVMTSIMKWNKDEFIIIYSNHIHNQFHYVNVMKNIDMVRVKPYHGATINLKKYNGYEVTPTLRFLWAVSLNPLSYSIIIDRIRKHLIAEKYDSPFSHI